MIAALTQRLERLEALTAQQSIRITEQAAIIEEQAAELKEWRSGVRIRGKRKQRRRRVRGAKEARDAAEKGEVL